MFGKAELRLSLVALFLALITGAPCFAGSAGTPAGVAEQTRILEEYDRLRDRGARFATDCSRGLGNAAAAFRRRDYAQTIVLYDATGECVTGNLEALSNRGAAYLQLGRNTEAIADLDAAILLEPTNPDIYSNRSLANLRLGDYDGVIADTTTAIRLRPRFPAALQNRGSVYLALERYDEAIADFTATIRYRADSPGAYVGRGDAYYAKSDEERAIADYTNALRMMPNASEVYAARCRAFAVLGRTQEANADCQKAQSLSAAAGN